MIVLIVTFTIEPLSTSVRCIAQIEDLRLPDGNEVPFKLASSSPIKLESKDKLKEEHDLRIALTVIVMIIPWIPGTLH